MDPPGATGRCRPAPWPYRTTKGASWLARTKPSTTTPTAIRSPPPAKKKGGCLKIALFGVLAIIIIAILASLFSGGSGDDGATGGSGTDQEQTQQDAESTAVGLGEEFTVGDWSATVASVDAPVASVGPSGFATEAQGEFVPVKISAKNTAKEEQTFFADNVKLIDAEGAEYSYSSDASVWGADSGGILLEPTNPGNTLNGYLWFDVPAGTDITQVKVSGGGFLDDPITVAVK